MDAMAMSRTLTLEEKAALLSGKDFWRTKSAEKLGLEGVLLCDGPHGVRKQNNLQDHMGLYDSVQATCFPAAVSTGNSFDRALLFKLGNAIGEECAEMDVAVLLGPGVNIKRSPLGGRNFEYFSEDPLVSGELGAQMILGVQSNGVGTSLKHFACNNQETRRMTTESVVDERALREIYLAGFERAVKTAKPWTVMCAYNLLFSELCSENKRLLTDILRNEWGFEGLTVTDWGAANDRALGVAAGLDLEMPCVGEASTQAIVRAVRSGALDEERVTESCVRVLALLARAQNRTQACYDRAAHHLLAREAAAECCVLLKNDGLLPGGTRGRIAVIGAFAEHPRYQGAGSSKINPNKVDSVLAELRALCPDADIAYAPGYPMDKDDPDERLMQEAVSMARGRDIVYLFAGLPDRYESEGFDRLSLALPECHTKLIEAVCAVNPNTAVILMGGGVMETPFADSARAILYCGLGGEAVGGACADVLTGTRAPGGRLAESWPETLADNPSYHHFPGYTRTVEYAESVFVGYRYYDTAQDARVRFPFGHGLSYTNFAYSRLALSKQEIDEGEPVTISLMIENTGARAGTEVAQLYVAPCSPVVFKPAQELRGFEKVTLAPGERTQIQFVLDSRAFAHYDTESGAWRAEPGEYEVRAASASRDIRLRTRVRVRSTFTPRDRRGELPDYYAPHGGFQSDKQFQALLGRALPNRNHDEGAPFTLNSTLGDTRRKLPGKLMCMGIRMTAASMASGNADMRRMLSRMLLDMPLRSLRMASAKGIPEQTLEGLLDMLNGHVLTGVKKVLKKPRPNA